MHIPSHVRPIRALVVTAACWALSLSAPCRADDPIRVGWIGPLTGNSAVLGIDSVEAVKMVFESVNESGGINGRKLSLIVEDDQYDAGRGMSAYAKLSADGVSAIITPTLGTVMATARRAAADKIVVIDPLDCNEEIAALPEYTFCVATQSESVGRVLAEDLKEKKAFPAFVLYDEKNPFMSTVSRSLEEGVGRAGSVESTGIDGAGTDFRALLTKIRARNPKAVVFLGHDPFGRALAIGRELGVKAQYYTVGTITSPGFRESAGASADGALVAFWEAPRGDRYDRFLSKFVERSKRGPILELASIPSYDTAEILVSAFRKAAGGSTEIRPEAVRLAMLETKDFAGVSGSITIDPDGAVRTIKERLYRYDQGKLAPVTP